LKGYASYSTELTNSAFVFGANREADLTTFTDNFFGEIDEVAIYSDGISSNKIMVDSRGKRDVSFVDNQYVVTDAGGSLEGSTLLAYYSFDDGTLMDYSGNVNTPLSANDIGGGLYCDVSSDMTGGIDAFRDQFQEKDR